MRKTKCKARKENGQRCAAPATNGSEFCFWHDPTKRQAAVEASRAGGSRGKLAVLPADGPDLPCTSPQEALQAVQTLISAVAKGQVDPRVANAAGTLLNVWKTLYEMAKAAAAAQGGDERARHEYDLEVSESLRQLATGGLTLLGLAEKMETDAATWLQEHGMPLPESYQRAAERRRELEAYDERRAAEEAARIATEEAARLAAIGQVATETR